jgi:hypothetical protein
MSDDDPVIVCCILGICCPAGSAAQLAETAKMVRKMRPKIDATSCERKARHLVEKINALGLERVMDEA